MMHICLFFQIRMLLWKLQLRNLSVPGKLYPLRQKIIKEMLFLKIHLMCVEERGGSMIRRVKDMY